MIIGTDSPLLPVRVLRAALGELGEAYALGLGDPVISWLATRDRIAEFGGVLAVTPGTLARLRPAGLQLQRPESGAPGPPPGRAAPRVEAAGPVAPRLLPRPRK